LLLPIVNNDWQQESLTIKKKGDKSIMLFFLRILYLPFFIFCMFLVLLIKGPKTAKLTFKPLLSAWFNEK